MISAEINAALSSTNARALTGKRAGQYSDPGSILDPYGRFYPINHQKQPLIRIAAQRTGELPPIRRYQIGYHADFLPCHRTERLMKILRGLWKDPPLRRQYSVRVNLQRIVPEHESNYFQLFFISAGPNGALTLDFAVDMHTVS